MSARLLLALLALALAGSAPAAARQLQYGQWNAGPDIVFDYTFEDFDRSRVRVRFPMNVAAIDAADRRFNGYDDAALDSAIDQAVQAYVRRNGGGLDVKMWREGRVLHFSFAGVDEKRIDAVRNGLDAEIDNATRGFFATRLLMLDGKFVLVDYAAVAREFTGVMAPMGKALLAQSAQRDERGRMALALALIQAIPYDTLQSRDIANGFGFITPPTLLKLNRGDCDSKTVALAAIAKHILPQRHFVIVLMPQHAVLGVDLPARPGDRTLAHQGRTYVLMEPAGPASFPVGKMFPISDKMLAEKQVERVIQLLP